MEIKEIEISEIVGSLCRMRLERDYEKAAMLESVRTYGVVEPVKVKRAKGGYLIFAGHRRLDCARELDHKTIKAEIRDDITDKEAVMLGFIENINRKDFTPLEEAHAYRMMIEEHSWTVEEVSRRCGKDESRIYKLLKLLEEMTPEMEKAIMEGKITVGHVLILLRFQDEKLRKKLFEQVLAGELNVHDLEYLLARQKPDEEKNEKERILDIVEDAYTDDAEVRGLGGERLKMHRSRRGLKIILDTAGPGELLMMYRVLGKALERFMPRFREIVGRDGEIP